MDSVKLISRAQELPLPVEGDGLDIDESIRLKYRYLDLRRPRMARNLRIRSKVITFIRNWLAEKDFVEIETPILTKTTPKGRGILSFLRDFSRGSSMPFPNPPAV